MKESELIEEGFERIDVLIEESGDPTDYYYFKLNLINNIVLTSNSSDEAGKKNWIVYLDDNNFMIKDIEDIQTLIALANKWSKK